MPIRHWRIGASREGFRPGKLLSKQLATGDLLTSSKTCEKVRLVPDASHVSHGEMGCCAASHSTGPSVAMRLFQSRRRSGQAATSSFVTRFARAMYSSWRSRTARVSAESWNRMLFS